MDRDFIGRSGRAGKTGTIRSNKLVESGSAWLAGSGGKGTAMRDSSDLSERRGFSVSYDTAVFRDKIEQQIRL
ncbi:hypothetical protein ACFS7Z_19720 [Pontibacter toksunensis]|uniref:Uncharacterized protein n=1 Tax=Pontibacter toksunensis TaxID=1332631 RepID=A0ABW6BXR0_9BACT